MTPPTEFVWVGGEPVGVSPDGRWHYWVAFTFVNERGAGNGALCAVLGSPILSGDDVDLVREYVQGLGWSQAVVSTWKLMQAPAAELVTADDDGPDGAA